MTEAIVWRTERRRIGDLVEWDRNPRQLTAKRAEDLAASLKRFGYVEEIVLNADGKSIIGGHQRRRVLMLQAIIDPKAEVDVRLPSRQLSGDEAEELAIRLNKNVGEWDFDKLANEFDMDKLIEWGFEPIEFSVGPEEATHPHPASAPEQDLGQRTIELSVDAETLEEFKALVTKLSERYGTDDVTSTVMVALRNEAKPTE